jgi:hypothetical protein
MAGFLQASGVPITMAQINSVFDGRGNNLNAYRGTTWFTAAGGSGTFSSGAISFNDFYLKGPSAGVTVSLASMNGTTFFGTAFSNNESFSSILTFESNGTWGASLYASGEQYGNWATPTTTGVGSGYWIQWTRTFFTGGTFNDATPTSGWQQLNGINQIIVTTGGISTASADYTVQISSSSSGSPVLTTANITILAYPFVF